MQVLQRFPNAVLASSVSAIPRVPRILILASLPQTPVKRTLSMTERKEAELSWLPLTEIESIDDILAALADFTTDATFGRDEKGLEYCTADGVSDAASPIFRSIGSLNKKDFELRGNALRLRPGTTTLKSRSAYIISVKVWGRNAMIGSVELAPRFMAHFKKEIQIKVEDDSVVDVFYVVEKPKKSTMQ